MLSRSRILLKLFRNYSKKGDVIDTGCGDGSFLVDLHSQYRGLLRYWAADISTEALSATDQYDFLQDRYVIDLENEKTLPKKHFDFVFSNEVLEHICDWKTALVNLVNLVEREGYLFITVPSQMKYWGLHDEFAHHYRRFEPCEIENELKKLHFTIVKTQNWGWPFYWLYYTFVLNNNNPKNVMSDVRSPAKMIASQVFNALFHVDDLFSTKFGRRIFIVSKKN